MAIAEVTVIITKITNYWDYHYQKGIFQGSFQFDSRYFTSTLNNYLCQDFLAFSLVKEIITAILAAIIMVAAAANYNSEENIGIAMEFINFKAMDTVTVSVIGWVRACIKDIPFTVKDYNTKAIRD